ncbi:MAG: NADH-quinone oxidoreductase subunit NuoH [Bacteroidetes bacterium]|nr:NADH-quinone oxidoreductase subunit NuoH [Bacteroidota bacterium]
MKLELFGHLVLTVCIFGSLFLFVAYAVYFERKVAAKMQNRVGPDRVGWYGLLQPFADILKLLLKEEIIATQATKLIHTLAPGISVIMAFITFAMIPIAQGFYIADINIGMLYMMAVTSIGVYGVTLAGWSSNSKYSLLGSMRASAQMISYELSMGLAVVGIILITQSMSVVSIVDSQTDNPFLWNIIKQPIGFLIFWIASFAEANRLPFDLPESEQELVGGFHTEYSSMRFALFFFAEYTHLIVASSILTTLYLGGYQIPYSSVWLAGANEWLVAGLQILMFILKMCLFVFLFMWVRWTLPRFKYNHLMELGWKYLLPLGLINVVVTAGWLLIYDKLF